MTVITYNKYMRGVKQYAGNLSHRICDKNSKENSRQPTRKSVSVVHELGFNKPLRFQMKKLPSCFSYQCIWD